MINAKMMMAVINIAKIMTNSSVFLLLSLSVFEYSAVTLCVLCIVVDSIFHEGGYPNMINTGVGIDVVEDDGLFVVGNKEGSMLGNSEGIDVGFVVGFIVGFTVGFVVGIKEGDSVGIVDGKLDGKPVGSIVGFIVGRVDGLNVDANMDVLVDGLNDGWFVDF